MDAPKDKVEWFDDERGYGIDVPVKVLAGEELTFHLMNLRLGTLEFGNVDSVNFYETATVPPEPTFEKVM